VSRAHLHIASKAGAALIAAWLCWIVASRWDDRDPFPGPLEGSADERVESPVGVLESPSSRTPADSSRAPAVAGRDARIQVLQDATGLPVPHVRCVLVSTSSAVQHVAFTDSDGCLSAASGNWEAQVDGFQSLNGSVSCGPGEQLFLWVARVHDVNVHVTDSGGAPVSGASVVLASALRADGYGFAFTAHDAEATTDEHGTATFSNVTLSRGLRANVWRLGFMPIQQPVGCSSERRVHVAIVLAHVDATAPLRVLCVDTSNRPISGVALHADTSTANAPFNVPVRLGATDINGEIVVPGWVRAALSIELSGPEVYPSRITSESCARIEGERCRVLVPRRASGRFWFAERSPRTLQWRIISAAEERAASGVDAVAKLASSFVVGAPDAEGYCESNLPVDWPVQLHCGDENGSWTGSARIQGEGWIVPIALAGWGWPFLLKIASTSPNVVPLSVRLLQSPVGAFERPLPVIRDGNTLEVQLPIGLSMLEVEGSNGSRLHLKGDTAICGQTAYVGFVDMHRIEIQVVDGDRRPILDQRVELQRTTNRLFRDIGGGWRAWNAPGSYSGLPDHSGRIAMECLAGEYEIWMSHLPIRNSHPSTWRPLEGMRIIVPPVGDNLHTVVAASSRLIELSIGPDVAAQLPHEWVLRDSLSGSEQVHEGRFASFWCTAQPRSLQLIGRNGLVVMDVAIPAGSSPWYCEVHR